MSAEGEEPADEPIKLLASSNRTSLRAQKPGISLAPYNAGTLVDPSLILTPDQTNEPTTSQVVTEYKGRRADFITFGSNSQLRLPGNSAYAYPIDRYEEGELVHFTVAMNDPEIEVICLIFDTKGKQTTLCDKNTPALTDLGRGMTRTQAETVDSNGVSVDPWGTPHMVMPYAARHKHTFSKGFNDPADYNTVEGTKDDKWFVVEYAPSIPRAYNQIYFTIQNKSSSTRVIHEFSVFRIAFVDDYGYAIKDKVPGSPIDNNQKAGVLS